LRRCSCKYSHKRRLTVSASLYGCVLVTDKMYSTEF